MNALQKLRRRNVHLNIFNYRCVFRRKLTCSRCYKEREKIRIVEVGPRDGLQNEVKRISENDRIRLIKMLARTGLRTIEGGSFVAPKYVPQVSCSMDNSLRDVV